MDTQKIAYYRRKILTLLLQKYERSQSFKTGTPGAQRPQMTITGTDLAKDYYDEMDYRKREWIHAALLELSAEGILEVTWPKLKENLEVRKIYLNFEGIERAYALIGQTPKEDKIRELSTILSPLTAHPWPWLRAWALEMSGYLNARKSAGLDLDDLKGYRDLVRVCEALPELDESIPKRIFSQILFQDTKHFEQKVEHRLVSLLRKIYPEELEKDEDYLDQVGIVDNPKLTLLAGPLILQTDNNRDLDSGAESAVGYVRSNAEVSSNSGGQRNYDKMDLSLFPGGVGLSSESVRKLSILAIPAQAILLIENLTTYYEVLRQPPILSYPTLVIYTGGFPHKATQRLLQKIASFLAETNETQKPVYHWGDIDYGGIRIFAYLKKNFFPALKPYRMDVATYREYVDKGLSFGEEQARKLEQLLTNPDFTDWHPVLEALLKYRKRVEQESIPVK